MPEWSNGTGLGPVSLVLTRVRIPTPSLTVISQQPQLTEVIKMNEIKERIKTLNNAEKVELILELMRSLDKDTQIQLFRPLYKDLLSMIFIEYYGNYLTKYANSKQDKLIKRINEDLKSVLERLEDKKTSKEIATLLFYLYSDIIAPALNVRIDQVLIDKFYILKTKMKN